MNEKHSKFKKAMKSFLLALILGALSFYPSAQSSLLSSYEALIEKEKKELLTLSRNAFSEESILKNAAFVKINPSYLQSLFFFSNSMSLGLIDEHNPCSFYALLENGLLSFNLGDKSKIILDIYDKVGNFETMAFAIETFIQHVYSSSCLSNKEYKTLYSPASLATTLKSLDFKIPRQMDECKEDLKRWEQNSSLAYLCASRKYFTTNTNQDENNALFGPLSKETVQSLQSIPYFTKSYVSSLCENLKNPQNFCGSYISSQVWQKVITGEYSKDKLEYICQRLLKKETLLQDDYSLCADRLTKKPSLCETLASDLSLSPQIPCSLLAMSMQNSKLKADYRSCPLATGQDGILTTHRMLRHFQKTPIADNACMNNPIFDVGTLFIQYAGKEHWPLKICFHNPDQGKETCEPFIPGFLATNKYSEHTVMSEILKTMRLAIEIPSCTIVSPQQFSPTRLEYQTGCVIVKDPKNCQSFNCSPQVYFKGDRVQSIRYETLDTLHFFPATWEDEKFSLTRILSLEYKQESTPIRNLSEAMFFLSHDPHSLIYGSGCLEDLLPDFFKKSSFTECSVTTFIIDGFVKENSEIRAIVRTGLDTVHLPRLIHWNRIFNAISNYQKIHPIKSWTLYGNK